MADQRIKAIVGVVDPTVSLTSNICMPRSHLAITFVLFQRMFA